MATLPSYIAVRFPDYGEQFDPSVLRSEMERGVPKQRVVNTHVLQQIQATFLFSSAADAAAFEDWYFNDLGRVDWFDMTHPRTGATIQARFVGGDIGTLVPLIPTFSYAYRSVTLEYLR